MSVLSSARVETTSANRLRPIQLSPEKLIALTQAALFEARRNLGESWPNPSVGAIVADAVTGEIFASAVTAPGGRPHAEVLALNEAGPKARGALLFTTLEPCSHYGHTPPCADAIVKAGVAGVIYGSIDPDPRVSGRGIARLEAQSIRCMEAPLAEEADWINLGHTLRRTQNRPFVQLKIAVDAAGMVAAGHGAPVWVTGEDARRAGHLLRAHADAILIGRGTLIADNPTLTCRLPGLEARSPVRVVVSTHPHLPGDPRLTQNPDPGVWIIHSASETAPFPAKTIKTLAVRAHQGKPDIHAVVERLAQEGITRLLVEGGPTMARAFLDAGIVDEAIIFRSPAIHEAATLNAFGDKTLAVLESSPSFVQVSERKLGPDTESVYRNRTHWRH